MTLGGQDNLVGLGCCGIWVANLHVLIHARHGVGLTTCDWHVKKHVCHVAVSKLWLKTVNCGQELWLVAAGQLPQGYVKIKI